MKTAEKLFNEHTTFSYLDTDDKVFKIVALTQFIKALTEHDNEIKQLIDEFYDTARQQIEYVGSANYSHRETEAMEVLSRAHTELKSKIGV